MRTYFLIFFFASFTCLSQAQIKKLRKGKDGLGIYNMNTVTITEKGSKKSAKVKRQMKKFNKLRYHILKVWPYANEAKRNLTEIEAELNTITDRSDQKKYLRSKEKGLFGSHEKDIRKLSFTQGKILIKLIDRQTGTTTYDIIKEVKGSGSAVFWQAIGGLFGYNLKKEYEAEEDDKALEYIVTSIESGNNPTFYDWVQVAKK